MQRGRAPPPPMFGGNGNGNDGMGMSGNSYEPGVQIPRISSAQSQYLPQQLPYGPGSLRRPSLYKADRNGVSIHCTFGHLSLFDILKVFLSEFLGTMILLFVGCSGLTFTPITFGVAIATSSLIFGEISGSHINPAVTIAAMIMGEIKNYILVPFYFIGQLAGAFAGYALHDIIMFRHKDYEHFPGTCFTLPSLRWSGESFALEFLMSAFYIMAICGMWDRKSNDNGSSIPLKRAFLYTGIVLCMYQMTSKNFAVTPVSMNSLRSFVPLAYHNVSKDGWKWHWIYWAGPNIGAVFGSCIYRFLKFLHGKSLQDE